MILRRDLPKLSLYHIGAMILSILSHSSMEVVDTLNLFEQTKSLMDDDLSLSCFLLSIDWLFLLGLVDSDNNGDIKKCF